ncbi:MAG: cytochrome P450 [Acidimicrobiales bacterium]|nr:cytochrome P450 [Acidimicrobiales bacterium]
MASTTDTAPLNWDPWNTEIFADPYPTFRRLQTEAPLYRNEAHDFWALSRFEDIERAFRDPVTFSSAKGNILELIQAGIELPPGTVIMEDPPGHTEHRKMMSRVFTPRKVADLEPEIRKYCADCLDPLVGSEGFDLIRDFGAEMPTRVIGQLFGIPEEDQASIRDRTDANLRTEAGQKMDTSGDMVNDQFAPYIDYRTEHPSDDLITELMNATFTDSDGSERHLTRQELLTYISVIVGAGNETTNRLIGWMGKLLAEHPDQRRDIVEDRDLIPAAVEEILRFEPPGPGVARSVTADVELHGQTVPAGSAIILLVAAANRDERRWTEPERFDIHREQLAHVTFGYGIHFCLGAALARIQGRIALDELLNRFPTWELDGEPRFSSTSTVRGFESLRLRVT